MLELENNVGQQTAFLYLTDMPQEIEKYGLCKTLLVRYEVIHIKHILTEIFVHKTIDIDKYLSKIGWTLFQYMEYMTNLLRKVHKIDRNYRNDVNQIVKSDRNRFFPTIELYRGFENIIALDFDGVVTKNSFIELYELCVARCRTEICSSNPTIQPIWFESRGITLPHKINSCKGKIKKLNKLIDMNRKNDFVFFIDNEEEYLEYAWIFGIKTYLYRQNKIKNFSLSTR